MWISNLRVLLPEERYPKLLVETVKKEGVAGNLIFDAQIVALCRGHGIRQLLSNDRDFTRFRDIEALNLP